MKQDFFWTKWETGYRIPYLILLVLFTASLLAYLASYYAGVDTFFAWEQTPKLEGINFKLDDIYAGPFQIVLESPLFVVEEYFAVSPLSFPRIYYYSFGAILVLCFTLWLSTITALRNWVYGLGIAIFALWLATLSFEYLGLSLGFSNSFLMVVLLPFLVMTHLFQTYSSKVNFWVRWVSYLLLSVGIVVWIVYGSTIKNSVIFLVNYGVIMPVVLSLAFIVFNGHEVLRFFWSILTNYNAKGGVENIRHFLIFSLIYLANIFVVFAEYKGLFKLDIYQLDMFWLLPISGVLGLLGFQQRNESSRMARLFPFAPVGAFLFLIWGTVSFSTIAFFFATANDSMIAMYKAMILYIHLGMGLAFFVYVLGNFVPLARQFVNLSELVYQGKIIPPYMMYYFGVGVAASLFVGSNSVPWFLAKGGYYLGVGDSYLLEKDYRMAELSYKVAHDENDFIGHRVNYMLAGIVEETGEEALELKYLRDALLRAPSPYVYVALSNELKAQERNLDAIFTLREGLKRFPNSPQLNNNLAMLYKANKLTDSTFYYLEQAERFGGTHPTAQNNLWAVLAENPLKDTELDALPNIKQISQNKIGWANKLALFSNYRQAMPLEAFQTDSTKIGKADAANFAYIYNFALNRAYTSPDKALSLINGFIAKDSTRIFRHYPNLARAIALYYGGEVQAGIRALTSIPALTEDAYLNVVAGLWLLEQQAYATALTYFNTANNKGNTQAAFYQAVALSEMRDFAQAIPLWIDLSKAKNEHTSKAQRMLRVLKDDPKLRDDEDKYYFIYYQSRLLAYENLLAIYKTMRNPDLKTRAAATLMLEMLRAKERTKANELYQNLPQNAKLSTYTQSLIDFAHAKMLLANQDYDRLLAQADKFKFVRIHQNYRPYFKAVASARKGITEGLEANYLKARQATPFDETVIIDLADYYFNARKDVEKAYLTIVEGVRTNPYSIALHQNYALLALEMGLDMYAEEALEKIEEMSQPEAFATFKTKYEERFKEVEEKRKTLLQGS